ncbi:hypothetical protein HPB50_028871 [Hyalomma asiaticum]|nr:hypothetical protein HPB50_028871 [Hyalomma asiaticum]
MTESSRPHIRCFSCVGASGRTGALFKMHFSSHISPRTYHTVSRQRAWQQRTRQHAQKPFCFAIQAVALVLGQGPAVCDGHLDATGVNSATSVSWLPAAWSSTPPANRCFKETTRPSMIISAWNHHVVTSVPVTNLGLLDLHPFPSHDS